MVGTLPVGALLLTTLSGGLAVREVLSLVGKTFLDIPSRTGAQHLVVLLFLLLF